MGVKNALQIGMITAALLLGWLYLPRATRQVEAQFAGYFAEQTVTYSVAINQTNPPATYYPLPNIGQAGHSLEVGSTGYVGRIAGCPVWLQGSSDNINWIVLASASSPAYSPPLSFAQGYYPYLRLALNPNASACNANYTIFYAGYQFPPAISDPSVPYTASVSGIAPIIALISTTWPNVANLNSITCYNPNASIAVLEIYDSLTPTLGTGIQFEIVIPPSQTISSSMRVPATQELQAAAVTSWNGAAPVTTPVNCVFAINLNGPFYH